MSAKLSSTSVDISPLAACKWRFSVSPVLMYWSGSGLKGIVGTALFFVLSHCPTQNRHALLLDMLNATLRSGSQKTPFSARHNRNPPTSRGGELQMR